MLKEYRLTQAKHDPCVYSRIERDSMMFAAVYVDDAMLFSNDNEWTVKPQ